MKCLLRCLRAARDVARACGLTRKRLSRGFESKHLAKEANQRTKEPKKPETADKDRVEYTETHIPMGHPLWQQSPPRSRSSPRHAKAPTPTVPPAALHEQLGRGLTILNGGVNAQIVPTLDESLITALKEARDCHRQVKAVRDSFETQLEALDALSNDLREQIIHKRLEIKVKQGYNERTNEAQDVLELLLHEAWALQRKQAKVEMRRSEMQNELEAAYQSHHNQQEEIFTQLEQILVGSIRPPPAEVVSPPPVIISSESSVINSHSDFVPQLKHKNSISDLCKENTDPQHVVSYRSEARSGSEEAEATHTIAEADWLKAIIGAGNAHVKIDPQENVARRYRWLQACLQHAERDFHAREDQYEESLEAWERKRANGEAGVESTLTFDMRHLQKAQKLTRRLLRVEEKFHEAKARAVAAGIDLKALDGDDLESGFIDDVEDGYRLSFEQAIVSWTAKGPIERWLRDLPGDANEPEAWVSADEPRYSVHHESSTQADFSDAGLDDEEENHDVDSSDKSWDVDPIEFGESVSVCAKGTSRRRIDRWRSTPGLASR